MAAKAFKKPHLEIRSTKNADDVIAWLQTLDDGLILNIGGPRESECKEAYRETVKVLRIIFDAVDHE